MNQVTTAADVAAAALVVSFRHKEVAVVFVFVVVQFLERQHNC